MKDSEIIELYNSRSEDAIAETDKKYRTLCLSLAKNILSDELDAEECLNDSYLTLWRLIPPERPERFPAFLCRIVKNLALKKYERNHAAKRDISAQVSFDELDEAFYPKSGRSVEHCYDEKELGEAVSRFLTGEKKLDRVIFVRRYWFYDSIADIAKKYRLGESGVKSKLMRTRERLRKYLTERGLMNG